MNYHFIKNLFEPTNYFVAFTTYREYTWLCIAVALAVSGLIYLMNKKIKIKGYKKSKMAAIACCVIFLATPFSLTNRFAKVLFKIIYSPSYRLSHIEVFKELTGEDFVDKKDLKAKISGEKPKNLVMIFLESFEQNFLDGKQFPGVADNIIKLTKEGEFYSDIPQVEGSGWTSAAIHTALCGSPEIYNVRRNKLFKTVTVSNLICLPDVLREAGYYQLYLGGGFKTFAGKSFFLELHSFDRIYGKDEILKEYDIAQENLWGWGVKDYDLFEAAKDKYQELSKSGKPFNLTILTIAPHAPRGIPDKRCKNEQSDPILNSVQCDDELLYDFIEFLKNQENYEDTLVLILPDHLVMGSSISETLNSMGKERRLYSLFLNSGISGEFSDKILYTDLATMVLSRLRIEHNAKFLLENRGGQSAGEKVKFIDDNVEKIRAFNNKTILQE
ncbi:MAG: sulfatase-like hydrolase/transferase [Rickettsiales bacterium]|nr:sulfatase-like hydrolase/transferase [Rickettsiales bacterium]